MCSAVASKQISETEAMKPQAQKKKAGNSSSGSFFPVFFLLYHQNENYFLRALTEQYIPPPRQPKIAAHNPIVR